MSFIVPLKAAGLFPRWLLGAPHADETDLRCLLRVSLQPLNVTELNDVGPPCAHALKQHRRRFTGHWWQIGRQKLPFSFTVIILADNGSRFMPLGRFMCWALLVFVFTREIRCEKGEMKKKTSESLVTKTQPLHSCVSLSAPFSSPVLVWVGRTRARLPCSSHHSRFVSLQVQVTEWHCAFMAALHGAPLKWLNPSVGVSDPEHPCRGRSVPTLWCGPRIGTGHQPHSGDWSRLYGPTGLQAQQSVRFCLIVRLCYSSSLGGVVSAITLKKKNQIKSSKATKCHEKVFICRPATSLRIKLAW